MNFKKITKPAQYNLNFLLRKKQTLKLITYQKSRITIEQPI